MALCANCSQPDSVKICGACKITHYCSTYCQRKHWKIHKKQCKLLSENVKLKEELDSLRNQVEEKKDIKKQIPMIDYNEVVSALSDMNKQSMKYDELEPKYNQLEDEYNALETKYNELTLDFNDQREKYDQTEKDYKQLQTQHNVYKESIKSQGNKITELLEKYQQLENQHKQLENQHKESENEHKELIQSETNKIYLITELLEKQQQLENQHKQMINKNEKLKSQYMAFKSVHERIVSDLNKQNEKLSQQLNRKHDIMVNERKTMQMDKWTTDDLLRWLINFNICHELYYKMVSVIENGECNGEDIISLTCSKDVSDAFGIENNKQLCEKIFQQIEKFQLGNVIDMEQKQNENNLSNDNKMDDTCGFRINIFSFGKSMVLNDKVTGDERIQSIKQMFKKQIGIETNVDDIHFYSKFKLLNPNETLKELNIVDERHLITVKFGADGAKAL